jgi:hypothetical protein
MTFKLRRLDDAVELVEESAARGVSRRSLLSRAVRAVPLAFAGVAVGSMGRLTDVMASNCPGCTYTNHNNCGQTCYAPNYCPSGYKLCCNNSGCGGLCPHPPSSGCQWIGCSGLGKCGQGFRVCTDCIPTSGGCSRACTCYSNVICTDCCTREDVHAEQLRIALLRSRN